MVLTNNNKRKSNWRPVRFIYVLYWFLLAYILAALVFWFFALNKQNMELSYYRIDMLNEKSLDFEQKVHTIVSERNKKTAQYAGEGVTFFLLIIAGAVLVFRMIRRQLNQSVQQRNFMMAITHELKTPIAVTKLNLETMMMRRLDEERQHLLLNRTIQEANRLNALCNNMLLLSQIDSGGYTITKEEVDLSELTLECMNDFHARFPNRPIVFHPVDDAIVQGDRILLQLSFNNLLDNALKYSGNEQVEIDLFREGKFWKWQVKDLGEGLKEGEQEKVFEKYYRGKEAQTKGTGLGLFLTQKIIKSHQGEIRVFSNSPHGCIFEIKLKGSKSQF